jgi:malate dehydrogenase (quinone)
VEEQSSTPLEYDVIVVGGGASGAALFYTLATYTDLPRIALLEKYDTIGSLNSNARNNSQTLHIGEIETNYSMAKVREVYPAAMMVKRYTDDLPPSERDPIIRPTQKMLLGVGRAEVDSVRSRFEALREIFPNISLLERDEIAAREPALVEGRGNEPIAAIFNPAGHAVDFGKLAQSLVSRAAKAGAEVRCGVEVLHTEKTGDGYRLATSRGEYRAKVVIFDTDAYTLQFAKRLGYGKEFSLIPIAGSFYFTPERLRGKVYRVQDPRMPFAAIHGDAELTASGLTRWGPTARFYPVLEARRVSTAAAFFASSGLGRAATWLSFAAILLDPIRFWYLLRNLFYDLPLVGTFFLLPSLRTIVPTMRWSEISRASGYGGMRLQRVDTKTRQLLLGEGKIVGDHVIFNMTPSPGASVCLYNAMRDASTIAEMLPEIRFNKEKMLADLCISTMKGTGDVSLETSYAS